MQDIYINGMDGSILMNHQLEIAIKEIKTCDTHRLAIRLIVEETFFFSQFSTASVICMGSLLFWSFEILFITNFFDLRIPAFSN